MKMWDVPFGVVKVFFVIALMAASATMPAHAADGDYVWAKQMGGSGYETGNSVVIDSNGNVYTTGFFQGTVDFDPGAGTANLTAVGFNDIFVSKLDSSGNFVWVKQFGGSSSSEVGWALALDSSGNVYCAGEFHGTVDFDPGAGTTNLVSAGQADIFVAKLDSSGTLLWAQQIGGSLGDGAYSAAVDSGGNVYTTGPFSGTVDFDPGAGTVNLTSLGGFDVFVSKLDSSGNFVWAKQMGSSSHDEGYSVAVDSGGNVHTTGHFYGTVDFDPGAGSANLTAVGFNDIFVSKLDSSGNFVWVKQFGGSTSEVSRSVVVDSSGNVYTTGFFQGTTDFDPGAGTASLTPVGNYDIFVSKLDSTGAFLWAKQLGGSGDEFGFSVAVDSIGNVFTTGQFTGTADFDPGAGTANRSAVAGYDTYVSKLDSSGAFVWANAMGGSNIDEGRSIAIDSSGNAYTTGQFRVAADFDPGAGTANLTVVGNGDIFVWKLSGPPPNVTSVVRANGSPTNAASVDYTVVFDQSVTGVDTGDFALTLAGVSGASVIGVSGSGTTYTVTVNTGTGDGTIRLDVTDNDSIVNGNSQPLGDTGAGNGDFTSGEVYTIDNTAPTPPSVSGTTSTNDTTPTWSWTAGGGGNGTFRYDLDTSGIWTETASTSFTPGFALGEGNHSLKVQERDAVGNWSADGFFDIFVDITAPSRVISSTTSNPTNVSPLPYTVTFTEPVIGYDISDLVASNGTISNFAGSGSVYTFDLTPTAQGLVWANNVINPCTDAAGNLAIGGSALARTFDSVAPDVSLSTTATDPTNASPILVTVTFTEPVTGFDAGDLTIGNGTVNNFAGSGDTYTFDMVPAGQGNVTADVAAGVCTDLAGNANTAATQLVREYDSNQPTVSMTSTLTGPTNTSPVPVTVTFSKNMIGFDAGDIAPTNGSVSNFATVTPKIYTFDLYPTGQGTVSADIAAAVATSTAGNPNQPGSFGIVYDSQPPTILLIGASYVQVNLNDPYTDAGATASDTIDGDVTGDLVIDTSNVDTGVVGVYTVTFNVSDAAGNAAPQATRTVEVINGTPSLPVNAALATLMLLAAATVWFARRIRSRVRTPE
ncbi:MAG: SBBP repeat-containing protein [Candidatus Hydrogenedentes bacterium]|nr:SBBP repeat-containing protein [Candidatus Hydrogenedentota bacterium]